MYRLGLPYTLIDWACLVQDELGAQSTLMYRMGLPCTLIDWACLVQDELGAQSTLMYRLDLPPGDNYTNARPEWAEWDAELPYNRSRSCTIFQGSLSVFQVESVEV